MEADERSAVLVLRVWREGGTADLRARITMTANADAPGGTETAAASEEEIVSLVRAWLEEFASS
ncbi:MAG: hypothetical protein ACXVRQ_10635 [Gaiellaceae bacterium]